MATPKDRLGEVFSFLKELSTNNSKEWMDAHRGEFSQVKEHLYDLLSEIYEEIHKVDPDYQLPTPRKALMRINNNLMFHPDKPTYKEHFGAALINSDKTAHLDMYLHIHPLSGFVGGGLYHPPSDVLKKVRQEIDYNGEALRAIIGKASFKAMFGELEQTEKLKTAPKGYDRDHRDIELLRLKNFVVAHPLTAKEMSGADFPKRMADTYLEMKPLLGFLERAMD